MSRAKQRKTIKPSAPAPTTARANKTKKAAGGNRRTMGVSIWLVGLPLLVVVLAGIGVWIAVTAAGGGESLPPSAAKSFAIQGTEHISPGESHPTYNSNPPTSGWHYAQSAPWGVQNVELPDEQLVHNLEHGGIWISYHPSLDAQSVDKLREITRRYRTKVILTPRSKDDSKIALAAWGKLDVLDAIDEPRILAFISAFYDKGPEKVAD